VPKERIAAKFHSDIAGLFIAAATSARATTGISQVILSGGCMHNRRLNTLLRLGLEERGLQVFAHRRVSPGDGGLSYGQAVIGATILKNP
jgi:hydrogenase maturation protein HypF